jgi:hypothetical protein
MLIEREKKEQSLLKTLCQEMSYKWVSEEAFPKISIQGLTQNKHPLGLHIRWALTYSGQIFECFENCGYILELVFLVFFDNHGYEPYEPPT